MNIPSIEEYMDSLEFNELSADKQVDFDLAAFEQDFYHGELRLKSSTKRLDEATKELKDMLKRNGFYTEGGTNDF